MADLVERFEGYKESKDVASSKTEFGGNGISFNVADGKIVASYDNPKLSERAQKLSQMHAAKVAANTVSLSGSKALDGKASSGRAL